MMMMMMMVVVVMVMILCQSRRWDCEVVVTKVKNQSIRRTARIMRQVCRRLGSPPLLSSRSRQLELEYKHCDKEPLSFKWADRWPGFGHAGGASASGLACFLFHQHLCRYCRTNRPTLQRLLWLNSTRTHALDQLSSLSSPTPALFPCCPHCPQAI
jgi:hypothetical protein